MVILGIGDSHEAHACIVRDGELCAVMAEERLSRLKADMGYPRRAIESVMKYSGTSAEEIDVVAFAGREGGRSCGSTSRMLFSAFKTGSSSVENTGSQSCSRGDP
jgi:predicted NodU family carbamoyl transferase